VCLNVVGALIDVSVGRLAGMGNGNYGDTNGKNYFDHSAPVLLG